MSKRPISGRQDGANYIYSVGPDVCWTPMGSEMVPVAYNSFVDFSRCIRTSKSVRNNGDEDFTLNSRACGVRGHERGTGKGVVVPGYKGWACARKGSSSVFSEGWPVVKDGDPAWINMADPGPEQPRGEMREKVIDVALGSPITLRYRDPPPTLESTSIGNAAARVRIGGSLSPQSMAAREAYLKVLRERPEDAPEAFWEIFTALRPSGAETAAAQPRKAAFSPEESSGKAEAQKAAAPAETAPAAAKAVWGSPKLQKAEAAAAAKTEPEAKAVWSSPKPPRGKQKEAGLTEAQESELATSYFRNFYEGPAAAGEIAWKGAKAAARNPRVQGGIQGVAGTAEAVGGGAAMVFGAMTGIGLGAMVGGGFVAANGVDTGYTGFRQMFSGKEEETVTQQAARGTAALFGADEDGQNRAADMAGLAQLGISIASSGLAGAAGKAGKVVSFAREGAAGGKTAAAGAEAAAETVKSLTHYADKAVKDTEARIAAANAKGDGETIIGKSRAERAREKAEAVKQQPMGNTKNQMNQPKNPQYQPVRNKAAFVNGREYSGHALDRMQDRGILPSLVENAIKNGIHEFGVRTNLHYDSMNNLSVIENKLGRIVTVSHGRLKNVR